MRFVASVLNIFSLAACSTTATLNLVSEPEGALITVSSNRQRVGIAPVQVKIELLESSKDKIGCYTMVGLQAEWISGAKVQSPSPIVLCGSKTGTYTYPFKRSFNGDGIEKDVAFANQRQQARTAEQQLKATQDAAWWAAFAAGYNNANSRSQSMPPRTPITCMNIGGGMTTCQ